MSVKDRRERQKTATREGILNAALQIAKAEGWAAVTVRRVAELVEYTPPIIYQYFANKGAMLEELQAQGFTTLADRMREVDSGGGEARERLLQMGDAYLRFAFEQPELYQLMHGLNSADVPLEKTLAGASRGGDIVQNCLEQWGRARELAAFDAVAAVDVTWALLHGLVSVQMLERISGGEQRTRRLARQTMEDLLTAWAAR